MPVDKNLAAKLKEEAPGILRWLVEGHRKYRQQGLQLPPAIREATDAYRKEVDLLGAFITEACETGEGHTCPASTLYRNYSNWCQDNGHKAMSNTRFGEKMGKRKEFHRKETRSGRLYCGIRSEYSPQRGGIW
jgi:putative DNA primase/helicase